MPVKERWVVVMRADDELVQKTAIEIEDLKNVPLILPWRDDVRSEIANYFGDNFKDLQIDFISNLSTNASIMVQNGLGYALVVEGSLPFIDNTKICCRPLSPDLTTDTFIAWKRYQPFSLAVEKFIEHIKCFLGMVKP